jgi:hypothetical protein
MRAVLRNACKMSDTKENRARMGKMRMIDNKIKLGVEE